MVTDTLFWWWTLFHGCYSAVAKQMGATVVTATQVGYLNALQTGYRFLLQHTDCTTVVQLDSDGQHNPLHIPRLQIFHIQQESSTPQWVVGSRDNTGTQADGTLNLAGGFFGRYVEGIAHHSYGDISSGFWCLNRSTMRLFLKFTPPKQSLQMLHSFLCCFTRAVSDGVPTEMGPRLSGQSMHHGVRTRLNHLCATSSRLCDGSITCAWVGSSAANIGIRINDEAIFH